MFGMDRTIAIQFLISLSCCIFGPLLLFGGNMFSLALIFASFPANVLVFRKRHQRNKEHNFKKRSLNRWKPSIIRERDPIILTVHEGLFDK